MPRISDYPSPVTLTGDMKLLGDNGETVAVPLSLVAEFLLQPDVALLLLSRAVSTMTDLNGGPLPAGPALVLDGGIVKFVPGASS